MVWCSVKFDMGGMETILTQLQYSNTYGKAEGNFKKPVFLL